MILCQQAGWPAETKEVGRNTSPAILIGRTARRALLRVSARKRTGDLPVAVGEAARESGLGFAPIQLGEQHGVSWEEDGVIEVMAYTQGGHRIGIRPLLLCQAKLGNLRGSGLLVDSCSSSEGATRSAPSSTLAVARPET
jgi:hypothetical protein